MNAGVGIRYRNAGVDAGDSDQVLLRRYAGGDIAAREILTRRHMPMASRLTHRYGRSTVAQEDLQQVAYLGLLKAIDRHDAELGTFIGFAVNTVRGELKRYFRDYGWAIRVTRPLQERCLKVSAAAEKLASTLGRSPSPRDIARETGFTLDEVAEAIDAADAYAPRSLDAPVTGEEDASIGEMLGCEDHAFESVELAQTIGPAFRDLAEREQMVIHLRFIQDLTQIEIGSRVGLSQMHVSRILRQSLDKLSQAVA